MAVTSSQLETLVANPTPNPFLQRIEYNMTLTAENVASEATSTALHAQRARLAALILQNPTQYLPDFAQAVIAQLPLSTTNLVTVGGVTNADVDTTDATIANTISAVWNDFLTS
jgi:hypothetical protein